MKMALMEFGDDHYFHSPKLGSYHTVIFRMQEAFKLTRGRNSPHFLCRKSFGTVPADWKLPSGSNLSFFALVTVFMLISVAIWFALITQRALFASA